MNSNKKGWDLLWEKKGNELKEFDPVKLNGFDNEACNSNKNFVEKVTNIIKTKLELVEENQLLEIGCGGGMLLIPLSKSVKKTAGVDLSSSLIKRLKEHLKGVDLMVSGANKLPFEPNSFDKILVHSIFQYFESLDYAKQSILEMIKVCKKKGKILIMDIPDLEKEELNNNFRKKFNKKTSDSSLKHRFYSKRFFEDICKENNLTYEIWDQDIEGYENSQFRFNILINK
jgi:ubiquinone/menaquinone biosynthesis C-methylase UbiE